MGAAELFAHASAKGFSGVEQNDFQCTDCSFSGGEPISAALDEETALPRLSLLQLRLLIVRTEKTADPSSNASTSRTERPVRTTNAFIETLRQAGALALLPDDPSRRAGWIFAACVARSRSVGRHSCGGVKSPAHTTRAIVGLSALMLLFYPWK